MKLLLFILFITAAGTTAATAVKQIVMPPPTDTSYVYYDANRNRYGLHGKNLEYIPVNAKESSSGIYSGGTYNSRELTEKQLRKLVALFTIAKATPQAHTGKNIKPNAAVEISCNNQKKYFLLQAQSAINVSINKYLKQLFKK